MEWEMMRGMADGQGPGPEGGRSPTGGPGPCPSVAPQGPTDGMDRALCPPDISMPEIPAAAAEWPEDCAGVPPEPCGSLEAVELVIDETRLPRLVPVRGKRLVKPEDAGRVSLTPEQRLLILDTWRRSGLPATDFGGLVGVSGHTLYAWKKRFKTKGPAGLMDQPRGGAKGSRLPELTKRTILMLKEANPDFGCERISALLLRGPALPASPGAVETVLKEAGYVTEEEPTRAHPDHVRSFERAKPNQLWQTDLFTFMLKRQNRRVYLVAYLDDHSRFIVGYGLHATQSAALVIEVLRAAIASYQAPEELLSDNGSQYVTWRGKSAFSRELERRGVKHIVSAPRHPRTLGKVERFWGSLWRECVERAVFIDMADAQRRIGLYIDYYNFQRPHSGIGGVVPADRFFSAAPEILATLKSRAAANALALARDGVPRKPFYLTGNAGGQHFSVHAEGERVILRTQDGAREEVELVRPAQVPAAPESGEAAAPAPSSAAAQESMPEPLCPTARPEGTWEIPDESAPGVSPLDGVVPLEEGGQNVAGSA
jgi:transposase InsO family protein